MENIGRLLRPRVTLPPVQPAASMPIKRAGRSQSVHARASTVPRQRKQRTASVGVRGPPVTAQQPPVSNDGDQLVVTLCRVTNNLIEAKKKHEEQQGKYIDVLAMNYSQTEKMKKLQNVVDNNQQIPYAETANTNIRLVNALLNLEEKYKKVMT